MVSSIPLTPKTGGGVCIPVDSLKPADIIVSTSNAPISRIIRAAEGFSCVSHAAVYVGDGNLVEATGEGVACKSVEQALRDDTLAVAYRHIRMTPGAAKQIVAFARQACANKSKYDVPGAIMANKYVCVILLNPLGCVAGRAMESSKRFYCSKLVFAAYKKAGLPLSSGVLDSNDPEAIVQIYSHSAVLQYIGHLQD